MTVDLESLLTQKMGYLNQRQTVLAENVANASTPGFKAHDLEAFTFNDALKQTNVAMMVTDPAHIIPASLAGAHAKSVKDKYETVPTGNAVDVEQEMMKVSQTSVDYQTVTSIYHSVLSLFKIAIKGSSS